MNKSSGLRGDDRNFQLQVSVCQAHPSKCPRPRGECEKGGGGASLAARQTGEEGHAGFDRTCRWPVVVSPVRYALKIYFFIESGRKMIQFKIQFKTKSGIFIQKNIHSIESRIFNRIIHSQKMRKIIQNSKMRPKYGFGPFWGPCIGNRPPEMDWNRSHWWPLNDFRWVWDIWQQPLLVK